MLMASGLQGQQHQQQHQQIPQTNQLQPPANNAAQNLVNALTQSPNGSKKSAVNPFDTFDGLGPSPNQSSPQPQTAMFGNNLVGSSPAASSSSFFDVNSCSKQAFQLVALTEAEAHKCSAEQCEQLSRMVQQQMQQVVDHCQLQTRLLQAQAHRARELGSGAGNQQQGSVGGGGMFGMQNAQQHQAPVALSSGNPFANNMGGNTAQNAGAPSGSPEEQNAQLPAAPKTNPFQDLTGFASMGGMGGGAPAAAPASSGNPFMPAKDALGSAAPAQNNQVFDLF